MCVRAIRAICLTTIIMGLIAGRAHRVGLLLIWVVGVVARVAIGLSIVVRTAEDLIW